MLSDEQKQELVQRVIDRLKKKADDDNDKADDKDTSVKDPLKNAKAIIKHYGTHNRLI